jgi:hypothetical protein
MKNILFVNIIAILITCHASLAMQSPLTAACSAGNAALVRKLIAQGEPANTPDINGWTPLHSAALGGHYEIVRILLENGKISQQIRNKAGYTPADLAETPQIKQLIERLPVLEIKPEASPIAVSVNYTIYEEPADYTPADLAEMPQIKQLIESLAIVEARRPVIYADDPGVAPEPVVSKSLAPQSQSVKIADHPLMNARNLDLLYELANKVSYNIDRMFPNKKQVLVGLGQSPAYLLEMIKLLDAKKHRYNRAYLDVAFSGSFYDAEGKRIDSIMFEEFNKLAPYYRKYMERIGLSKQDLDKANTQFIVLEVSHTCKGLKSFLQFFADYTIRPFVIYLQSHAFSAAGLEVPNERIALDDNEEKLMVELANADKFKDRLVPHFSYYEWETIDPLSFKPDENVPVIMEQLRQFVDKIE